MEEFGIVAIVIILLNLAIYGAIIYGCYRAVKALITHFNKTKNDTKN